MLGEQTTRILRRALRPQMIGDNTWCGPWEIAFIPTLKKGQQSYNEAGGTLVVLLDCPASEPLNLECVILALLLPCLTSDPDYEAGAWWVVNQNLFQITYRKTCYLE